MKILKVFTNHTVYKFVYKQAYLFSFSRPLSLAATASVFSLIPLSKGNLNEDTQHI